MSVMIHKFMASDQDGLRCICGHIHSAHFVVSCETHSDPAAKRALFGRELCYHCYEIAMKRLDQQRLVPTDKRNDTLLLLAALLVVQEGLRGPLDIKPDHINKARVLLDAAGELA